MAIRRFNIKLGRVPVCIVGDAEMADESSSGGVEISDGVAYTDTTEFQNSTDDLAVFCAMIDASPENIFDDDTETYFDSSYLNFKSAKGNIKEIVIDVYSGYWDTGITVYGTNDDSYQVDSGTGSPWEEVGVIPVEYNTRNEVTYILEKSYKYLGFRMDRKWIYSMKVKV